MHRNAESVRMEITVNINLETKNPLSIYEQICKAVKNDIINGELVSGDMLPSIRALAMDLQVSVISTKRAYEELEKEGLIYSVLGKGFYISKPDRKDLKEKQIMNLEADMERLIAESKKIGLTFEEVQGMLKILYEGGK